MLYIIITIMVMASLVVPNIVKFRQVVILIIFGYLLWFTKEYIGDMWADTEHVSFKYKVYLLIKFFIVFSVILYIIDLLCKWLI